MSKQTDDIHWYGQKTPESVTLRDYFAAAALQGLLSIMAKDYDAFFANKLAHACYETADAMLKAREVKP